MGKTDDWKIAKFRLGIIITILSFLYTIYVAIKGKKKQQIEFARSNYNIVEGNGIEKM